MKKILVLSYKDDPHANVICTYLEEGKTPFFRIDTEKFSKECKFSFNLENLEFRLSINKKEIILDSSWNIWNRRIIDPEIEDVENSSLRQIICDETKAMWKGILSSHQGGVINDPSNNYKASDKINQLIFAKNYGKDIYVPDTLLTNDPVEAREFWIEHNKRICFKLQKGAVVTKGDTYFPVYTNLVSKKNLQHVDLIRKNPHLFQEYQDKTYEVRIVTIGEKSIGTAIYSQKSERSKIDFRRYDFDNVPYKHIELPENVSEFCSAMLKNYKLHFGVFDFIFYEDKGYIFLELNPNGQWLWLEEYTGYKIGKEISDYLSTV